MNFRSKQRGEGLSIMAPEFQEDHMTGNFLFNIDSLKNISKLTLKGGLASKICLVLIFVAIAMAAIAWASKNFWLSMIIAVLVFLLTIIILWRLINVADKNPPSALMEGMEFLVHEQMVIGTKDNPKIIINENDIVLSEPISLSHDEELKLKEPDPEPTAQLESEKNEEKGDE